MRVVRSTIHWPLVAVIGLLTAIGLMNLYSALHLWGAGSHVRLFWMQLAWAGAGSLLCVGISRYDYRLLQRWTPQWVAATMVLLLLVLVLGRVVGGNKNWLGVGGFGMQPSELAKLVVVFIFAKFFTASTNPHGYGLRDLLRPGGLLMAMMGLIALGGDMGTTLFFGLLGGSMIGFAKLRWQSLVAVVLILVATGLLAYRTVMTPSQRGRVTTFLHPGADPRGKGYQMLQSRIAIGSGQWFGRGYLRGTVNKLRYLPEKHTDFIFPVLAEEWGFVGCLVTVIFYFILLSSALAISRDAGDRYGNFLALGIVFLLFWQIAINLGGVLGLLPMTGVTLPFLSYGGSSMLVTFSAIGLLLSIHRRKYLF